MTMREERGGRESREGGGELLMSWSECGLVVHPLLFVSFPSRPFDSEAEVVDESKRKRV